MRTYETVVLCRPELSDEQIGQLLEKAKQWISAEGGEVLHEERLGRRKLAYPIRHVREGNYIQLRFNAPTEAISRLERQFRVSDSILRFMTTPWKPKAPEKIKTEKAGQETTGGNNP